MTEKTLGYVELEWTCKRCGTKNPGTQKTCSNCGAVMSEQDQFELPAQQELITDNDKLAQAEQGPDVHCPYCGARNPAGTQVCSQCGAELGSAQARQKGQVMGAYSAQTAADITCPACGTANPANAARCRNCGSSLTDTAVPPASHPQTTVRQPVKSNKTLIVLAAVFITVLCLGGLGFLFLSARSQPQPAVVQSVQWQRSIEVVEQQPVEHQDWRDQIPAGADVSSCNQQFRRMQAEPAPGAEEVCGTPYSVDQGSGVAKVVQDCEYRIYEDWCSYNQMEWVVVDVATAQGSNMDPAWPALNTGAEQREGERSEQYAVVFQSDGKTYSYSLSNPNEFIQFTPGSEWILDVNTFGAVTAVREK